MQPGENAGTLGSEYHEWLISVWVKTKPISALISQLHSLEEEQKKVGIF